tara:strand:+ start:1553 stop:2539 length:987 start_codon:yes stop_codon:yes gene_type:complete
LNTSKKICVVGAGRWGLNHVKTLCELNALGAVVDNNDKALQFISKTYESCKTHKKLSSKVIDEYDGFIIATDPSSHFELAKKIILGMKPVLVEKPLTLDYNSSKTLCDLAMKMDVNLMVGHILLFHPAFQMMKKLIEDGKIGEIQYIYSNRLNMGSFRTNENVFWSFAPHDISLFNFFFNQNPKSVNSTGIDILQKGIHDSSITSFNYEGKKMGHIFVSWLHPFKEHRFVIIGSEGMLHFEDSVKNKPLIFYDNKAEFENLVPIPKNGEVVKINYSSDMPLTNELKYFISNLDSDEIEISSGFDGLKVIKVLECASKSLETKKHININ